MSDPATTRAPFWSDNFDMDLLKIFPEAPTALGPIAERTIYTVGGITHGRLNHPSVWNTDLGLAAFFGVTAGGFLPAGFVTGRPDKVVECTVLEAIRDCWVHTYAIVLKGRVAFDTNGMRQVFDRVMYHRRGWLQASEDQATAAVDEVVDAVVTAGERFAEILG